MGASVFLNASLILFLFIDGKSVEKKIGKMSTKRPASDAGGSDGPPAKKSFTRIEPLNLGSIYSLVNKTSL
jgi:hypothetical protein